MRKAGYVLVTAGIIAVTAPQIAKADTTYNKNPKMVPPISTNRPNIPRAPGAPLGTGMPNSIPKSGTQKVLLIRVNFKSRPFTKDEAYYNDKLFGTGRDSLKTWLNHESLGKFGIEPLNQAGGGTPGIITIDVDDSKYPGIKENDYKAQDQIMNDVLIELKDKLTPEVLASADKNGNKKLHDAWLEDNGTEPEELAMFCVFSGSQSEGTQPQSWPHLSTVKAVVNGYTLENSAVVTSEIVQNSFVGASTLTHEFCHGLSARDMYNDNLSIGPWSIMDECYGNRDNASLGQDQTPLDPIHKSIYGWGTEHGLTSTTSPTKFQYDARNKYLVIPHPTDKKIEYLFEYRDFGDDYEKALFGKGMRDSGVIVWKINKDTLPKDWSDGDWKFNTPGPRTSAFVMTKDTGEITIPNSLHKVGTNFTVDELPMEFTVSEKALGIQPIDNTKPEVEPVINAKNLSLKVNDKFDPMVGVTAHDETNKDITSQLKVVENTVNTSKPGKYIVVYQVTTAKSKTITKQVDVTVVGTEKPVVKPTITVKNRTIKIKEKFNPLDGVTAKDSDGNDITSKLKVEENTVDTSKSGNYVVVVSVTDSRGTSAVANYIVEVTGDEVAPKPDKDTKPPTIEGLEDLVLKVGDRFNPKEGVTAKDDLDGSPKLEVVENTVDTSKAGTYVVVYQASDASGNKTVQSIKVVVKPKQDVKPLDTEAPKLTVENRRVPLGTKLDLMQGVSAVDNIDGDITSQVTVNKGNLDVTKTGNYSVVYTVKDKAGNITNKTATVEVYSSKPVITGSDLTLTVGDDFKASTGMHATDVEDGDITSKLKVTTTTVDTSKPGIYKVKYEVTDKDGHTTEFVRKVVVFDKSSDKREVPLLGFDGGGIKDDTLNISMGDKFAPMKYIAASDKEDGDITKNIRVVQNNVDTNKVGKYTVTYEVKDKDSNRSTKVLNVNVLPKSFNNITGEAPLIDIPDVTLNTGDKFNPKEGLVALDKKDGDITNKVVVSRNDVNTNRPGKYKVTYTVVDSDKNVTNKTITVTVTGDSLDEGNNNSNSSTGNTSNKGDNSNGQTNNLNTNSTKSSNDSTSNSTKQMESGSDKPKPIPNALRKLKEMLPGTGTIASSTFIPGVTAIVSGLYLTVRGSKNKKND